MRAALLAALLLLLLHAQSRRAAQCMRGVGTRAQAPRSLLRMHRAGTAPRGLEEERERRQR